jgi:hypothetical protein
MDFDSEGKDAGVLFFKGSDPVPTNPVLASSNFWAACANCAAFVDAEDIDGLWNYAGARWKLSNPAANIGFQIHLRHTYELFFANRIRVAS